MTDISVVTTQYQSENRSWLLSEHGTEPGTTPGVTLDISKFDSATHYPNGYIPSGVVIGLITATGLYGPYDPDGADGRETATGILFGSLPVRTGSTKVGGAQVVHGFVDESKLPFASAAVGTEGRLDAAAKADLPLIHFS